jgi:hypothetical protein
MTILQKPKNQFLFFIIIFFIINFIQSYYTGLLFDEAYYWVWSKNLAFGYFDHPPMVALWIKISGLFFDGELGVRFFSNLSFSVMLYLIWSLIEIKQKWNYVWLYFLLIVSVALINVYGFVTTPDTPLLLFITLFLYIYKRFLVSQSIENTLILGFSMAAMLYSKYHGILIIFFVILSNLALLKNKKFWMASLFGVVLFIPHLHWQYINDFPTFRYHLFERGNKDYKISYSIMHLVNQIAIVGITFPLIYYAFINQKSTSKFDKSLKYITYGLIGFFLFTSFRVQPQAQWTGAILIPLVIMAFKQFVNNKNQRKWMLRIGLIQLVILLLARVIFAVDNIIPVKLEPHISKTWVNTLQENTLNKPIVFVNSYQNASIYNFYTKMNTHSFSSLGSRKSQYDIGDFENTLQNQDVFVVEKENRFIDAPTLAVKNNSLLKGHVIKNYTTFQKVKCIVEEDEILMVKQNEINSFIFTLINTYNKNLNFENVKFIGVFYHNKRIIEKVPLKITGLTPMKSRERKIFEASFISPYFDFKEGLTFRISLQFYDLPDGFQSNKINIKLIN